MSIIDSTLNTNETTQTELRKHNNLVTFIETHCQERAYSFQATIICKFLIKTFKINLTLAFLD